MRRGQTRFTIALYLMALVGVCDQLSKWWVVHNLMQPPQIVPITSFMNFVFVENKGVTFGLFSKIDHHLMTWFLVGVALVIVFLLGRWLWQTTSNLIAVGLGLVMGGAVGNIVDRIRYGAVIDFIDLYYGDYHWYAFNIADAAIVTGVGLLLLDNLVRAK